MKNIFIKMCFLLGLVTFVVSCDEDDFTGDSALVPSNPSLSVALSFANTQTFVEKDATYDFTVTLSEPQIVNVVVYLKASGTATEHEDYDYPHSLTIPAGALSVSGTLTTYRDGIAEPTENVTIQIGTGLESNVSTINGQTVSFTLLDYAFCTWTLDATDVYGDGWNGGYIELTTEGETTTYAADGANSFFEIPITVGADYSFTYVSGGGTGGGPGWESENYYVLTAPDGTEYIDGTLDYSGIPTPGLITSGTSSCN